MSTEKYDDTLIPFLALMRAELHANSDKGDRPGWLKMSSETALLEIYWHTAKLSAAVKNNNGPAIIEHSADVANMAMMLLDVCGGLGFPAATSTPTAQAAPAAVAGVMQFGGCPECGSRSCVARQCSRTVSHKAQAIPGVQWQCGPQANGFTAAPAATADALDAKRWRWMWNNAHNVSFTYQVNHYTKNTVMGLHCGSLAKAVDAAMAAQQKDTP